MTKIGIKDVENIFRENAFPFLKFSKIHAFYKSIRKRQSVKGIDTKSFKSTLLVHYDVHFYDVICPIIKNQKHHKFRNLLDLDVRWLFARKEYATDF